MDVLSLYELNNLVRRCLEQCFEDEYWVQAELSDVRINASGHCYFEMVQKDESGSTFIARARGMIFAHLFRFIKPFFEEMTGQSFVSGIKVKVKVSISFHESYGYALNVKEIDPAYTLGEMANRRREILKQLEKDGILTLNKELKMPVLLKRIAVISSATAAGYGDFCHQLEHNPYGFYYLPELFQATMQGERTEESILEALDAVHARLDEFDVVAIIRGGGATSDFSGFETYMLAAGCAQFPLPIIVGIGHERDTTVLDDVANVSVKTPTAAAEYIVNRTLTAAARLSDLSLLLKNASQRRLEEEKNRLSHLIHQIPSSAYRHLGQARIGLSTLEQQLKNAAYLLLQQRRHRLELIAQRICDCSPERLLERGYSVTFCEGKVVKSPSQLKEGAELLTKLKEGEVRSVVTK